MAQDIPSDADLGKPELVPADKAGRNASEKTKSEKAGNEAAKKAATPAKAARKAPPGAAATQPAAGGYLVEKYRILREFFEEAKVELKKITWPTRKETVATSIAVVVLVIVMAIFLGVIDAALTKLVALILS